MDQTFRLHHWGLALLLAVGIHLGLFMNYEPEIETIAAPVTSQEIVIGLKKLTTPPPPVIEKPVVVKQPPEVVPKKVTKPKPKKKPKIVKPKVMKPIVEPTMEPSIEPKQVISTPKVQSAKPTVVTIQSAPNSDLIAKQKSAYLSQLAQWLERHKQYPSIARRRNQQGEVVIQFTMSAEGKLLHHSILKPSSHESLNKATRKMIEKAAPLPPVPLAMRNGKSQFTYSIPVRFTLDK